MKRLLCFGFLAALLVSLPLGRTAADEKKIDPARDGKSPYAKGDQEFIANAAAGGMLEVKLGELAVANSNTDAVKKFGERMILDHTKANQELKQVVAKKGLRCPDDLQPKQKEEYDRLAKLKGAEFDRAYVPMMVSDHKEDIAAFENEVRNGADPALRDFAERTLPTIREHLGIIQTIAGQNK